MIFEKKIQQNKDHTLSGHLVASLSERLVSDQVINQNVAQAAYSTEGYTQAQVQILNDASKRVSLSLEGIAKSLKIDGQLTQAQIEAGTVAALVSGDIRGYLSQPVAHNLMQYASESTVPVALGFGDAMTQRPKYNGEYASEAYDEKDNRNAVVYSIAYNIQAARQNEFGEAWYPTVTVSPDNLGFMVTVRIFNVFDEFKRNISGAITDYKKKNLLRAYVDHTILKNDQTRLTPVHRAQSAANFVDGAVIAPFDAVLEGESIHTAPLAVGKRVDLLGISQTDALLASGVFDVTDSIDSTVALDTIYIKVGADVLKFNTSNLPFSMFSPAPQGLHRLMNLAFSSTSLLINDLSTRHNGAALVDLVDVVNNHYIIRLDVTVTGNVNLELGNTVVYGNSVFVSQITDQDGNVLDPTLAPQNAVVNAINAGSIIGYDLKAYRTNLNRRSRGQLIDTTFINQLYGVNLRSPLTSLRPVTADGQTDTSDLAALVTGTHIRTSNEAVTALIAADATLSAYVDSRDSVGQGPDILGVSRVLVRPTYAYDTLDCATDISNLTSSGLIEDLRALICNKIRDMFYRLIRDSNYNAANEAMNGANARKPTILIGTDPVIASYLMITGDLRSFGPEYEARVVSTIDERMKGRIYIGVGQFDSDINSRPNPLHNGCMAWKTELTLVLPISRDGQVSKELTVTPSFAHIQNLGVLGRIDIANIETVVSTKAIVNFHPIP